jgi:hypothetical protein
MGIGYEPFQWKRGELCRVTTAQIKGREDVLFKRA